MPYIAGIFVIDSNEYKILSCNNAIARNLFGKSFDELENHSIDELIPNFTKILHAGIEATSNYAYQLSPGLVLPEHFFRKYDAFIKSNKILRMTKNLRKRYFLIQKVLRLFIVMGKWFTLMCKLEFQRTIR